MVLNQEAKLAEFNRVHQETGESWEEFCKIWDLAKEEAKLEPEPISKEMLRGLIDAYQERVAVWLKTRQPGETLEYFLDNWDYAQVEARDG